MAETTSLWHRVAVVYTLQYDTISTVKIVRDFPEKMIRSNSLSPIGFWGKNKKSETVEKWQPVIFLSCTKTRTKNRFFCDCY